jgi:putative ABC transport system ATP-binding protein
MVPLLALEAVTRSFAIGPETVHALSGVSIEIQQGESVSITGPSGSGKTVLLNIMGLLDQPTDGRHWFAGRDVSRASDDERTLLRNRLVGFVFQSPFMLPRLSVAENVALPLLYRRVAPREALAEAAHALERVGLADLAARPPAGLSGGQVQRAALARALVGHPDMILADEPTAALDEAASEQVLSLLLNLHREEGATVVLVTHKREDAARCARQLRLSAGRFEPAPGPGAR